MGDTPLGWRLLATGWGLTPAGQRATGPDIAQIDQHCSNSCLDGMSSTARVVARPAVAMGVRLHQDRQHHGANASHGEHECGIDEQAQLLAIENGVETVGLVHGVAFRDAESGD